MESNLRLKVGALASSLLLGAVFISFRAGAFDSSSRSSRSTIQTPPVPAHPTVVVPPRTDVKPAAVPAVPDQQLFAGSKSAAVFVEPQSTSAPPPQPPAPPPQPTAQQAQQSAVIMSGSKSLMPAAPRQQAAQALQQAGGR